MSTPTSGREGESPRATGRNILVREADREAQAGSSTQSQAQPPNDGPSNFSEHFTVLVILTPNVFETYRRQCSIWRC